MHRISNPRDVEEADGPPSAPSTVARSTREQDPLRASSNAWFVGVLVAGYGLLLVGTTSAEWLSLGGPGSHLGPPSIIQASRFGLPKECTWESLASSSPSEGPSFHARSGPGRTRADCRMRN